MNNDIGDRQLLSNVMQNINRDYSKTMIYGDFAITNKGFSIKDTTAVARIGFSKYF